MDFVKETTARGAFIPRSAFKLCGFGDTTEFSMHAVPGAAVLLKREMTAMDLVDASRSLAQLSETLFNKLTDACGYCWDNCENEDCPYTEVPCEPITLPVRLRQEAGIPEGRKLCAEVNAEEKTVTVCAVDYEHDLSDVPEELMDLLVESEVCLCELERLLMDGDVIANGE